MQVIIKVCKEDKLITAPILAYPCYHCLEHKSYVILGGLGGFGIELADWLISRGARNLTLTSRTEIKNGYQKSRMKLWQSRGVNVQIVKVKDDLNDRDCMSVLRSAEKHGPVDAIFNLAVVLKDNILVNQSPRAFEDCFKPKARVTKMMDEVSRIVCLQLRHFVVFSSMSCGRGNVGQTNYGMANSVMERICEKRMKDGLHGLAIQWSAIDDVGIAADMLEDDKKIGLAGILPQDISFCLDKLEIFLLQDCPIVSSLIVAEKSGNTHKSKNILETVAHIMSKYN